MIAELGRIIDNLKRLKLQAEKAKLCGIVGYYNRAINDLEECVRVFPKHKGGGTHEDSDKTR